MTVAEWILLVAAAAALASLVACALWLLAAHVRFVRHHRRAAVPVPGYGPGGALAYYRGFVVSVLVALWWTLRALGRGGPMPPAGEPAGPPVLCVHGFLVSDGCFWGLRRRLARLGRPSVAPYLGRPFRPLEGYAPVLERAIEELAEAFPDQPIDVVAHSMGGIVLRVVAARRPDLARRFRRVVTLGTPHAGTPVSHSLPVGPEVLQMAVGSAFLERLPGLADTAPEARVTTVAAIPDLVVFPAATAHLPGARRVDLVGVSHLGLVVGRRGREVVVEALGDEPSTEPDRSRPPEPPAAPLDIHIGDE